MNPLTEIKCNKNWHNQTQRKKNVFNISRRTISHHHHQSASSVALRIQWKTKRNNIIGPPLLQVTATHSKKPGHSSQDFLFKHSSDANNLNASISYSSSNYINNTVERGISLQPATIRGKKQKQDHMITIVTINRDTWHKMQWSVTLLNEVHNIP